MYVLTLLFTVECFPSFSLSVGYLGRSGVLSFSVFLLVGLVLDSLLGSSGFLRITLTLSFYGKILELLFSLDLFSFANG